MPCLGRTFGGEGAVLRGILVIRQPLGAATAIAEACDCVVLRGDMVRGGSRLTVRFKMRGLAKLSIAHAKGALRCVEFAR
jgi:hypothetical protein